MGLIDDAREDVTGMPLGGIAAAEAHWEEDFDANPIDPERWEKLSDIREAILKDPRFMSR